MAKPVGAEAPSAGVPPPSSIRRPAADTGEGPPAASPLVDGRRNDPRRAAQRPRDSAGRPNPPRRSRDGPCEGVRGCVAEAQGDVASARETPLGTSAGAAEAIRCRPRLAPDTPRMAGRVRMSGRTSIFSPSAVISTDDLHGIHDLDCQTDSAKINPLDASGSPGVTHGFLRPGIAGHLHVSEDVKEL